MPANNSLPTTHAHEVALKVIIETGFRCLPDTPNAYEAGVDPALTEMLGEIPFSWDETRFVAGEPGKFFVMYRRLGNTAYIAGINGETTSISAAEYALSPDWQPAVGQSRDIEIDLADFGLQSYQDAIVIADNRNTSTAEVSHVLVVGAEGKLQVHMEPFGGFAIRLEVLP
jgi:hypothetical protein